MKVKLNFMNVKLEDIECEQCKNIYTIDEMEVERQNQCLGTTCQVCMNENYITLNVNINKESKVMNMQDLKDELKSLQEDKNNKLVKIVDLDCELEEIADKTEELEAELEDSKCEVAEIEEKIEELEMKIANFH